MKYGSIYAVTLGLVVRPVFLLWRQISKTHITNNLEDLTSYARTLVTDFTQLKNA